MANWWDQYETRAGATPAPAASKPELAPVAPAAAGAAPAASPNWWDAYDRHGGIPEPASTARPSAPGALQSTAAGIARGAKDVIDTGAKALASGFDKLAGTNEGSRVAEMNASGTKQFDAEYGGSAAASVGRVAGQVAATMPVGGFLGQGMRAAGAVGLLPGAAIPLGEAIASGGLRAAGAGLATRAAGGAISGGAAAGLVDPDQALTGAAIGGALPVVVRGAAQGMQKVGQAIRGPEVPAGIRRAVAEATAEGYVIPPTQAQPSLKNRLLEGMAGKATVSQNASARNQEVTNRLSALSLGLPGDTPLTPSVLQEIRSNAGQAYKAVASLPVKPAERANPMFNKPASPEINPAKMVEDLKQTRNDAQAWFKAYNRSASPEDLAKARAADSTSKRLETELESYAAGMGQGDLVQGLRDARTLIAKTYSVERAMNPTTGNVDAQTLAKLAKKGVLSGGLKVAANMASAFPKAAQPVERMGSLPQLSPLDWAAAGSMGAATGSPLAATGLVARPLARAAALSAPVQRGLSAAPVEQGRLLSAADRLGSLDYLTPAATVGLTARDR